MRQWAAEGDLAAVGGDGPHGDVLAGLDATLDAGDAEEFLAAEAE